MDFEQYVAARYGRLIEHAVLLGCAEGEAGAYVDQVLLDNKKAIRKAADPDPVVHEALDRAISGRRRAERGAGPFIAIGLVAVVVAVAVALTYRPQPEPVPSLFGLDGPQAQRLLERQGYDVVLRPSRACEPQGLVLGSEPKTGVPAREGATVTVRTAVPSDIFCEAHYTARSDAWAFVAFALGGPAPKFAGLVNVVVDSSEFVTLRTDQAGDGDSWGRALRLVRQAAMTPAPTATGMPRLVVSSGPIADSLCGVPRPAAAGDRPVLRLEIDPRDQDDGAGCPLTVDLYRNVDRVIDAVAVYTPKGLGGDDDSADVASQ